MNILIHNPCPADPDEHPYWGDHAFGHSLSLALEAEGHSVQMRYREQWDPQEPADLLLVLRGIEAVPPPGPNVRHSAVWLISHPSRITDQELAPHDQVFSASRWHTEQLREAGHAASTLLQCTDGSVFHARERNPVQLAHDFVFVGNTRGKRRWLVARAMAQQLPLRIWGRGWRRPEHRHFLVGQSWPNALLGNLYRASFASLNDHHQDMTDYHYVNNRIFDSLACGTPVLSEPNAGLHELGFQGIKVIEQDRDFSEQIDEFLLDHARFQAGALADARKIAEAHTFQARARELLAALDTRQPARESA